jgi:Type IV secretion-system coupling protein DNA-binding domain
MARATLAFTIGVAVSTLCIGLEGAGWTDLQRYYFPKYIATETSRNNTYRFLYVLDSAGWRMANSKDVARGGSSIGGVGSGFPFVLSAEARRQGATKLEWREFSALDSTSAREWLRLGVYEGRGALELMLWPVVVGSILMLGFFGVTFWRDRENLLSGRKGKIIRGPRLVKYSEFNSLKDSDGIGFEVLVLNEKTWHANINMTLLRIRRDEETSHLMLVGDSGTGKSSLIRQLLAQIRMRGETAIVYDPALEFTPQFYDPAADVILNPTDRRMPFWSPTDEVKYPVDAASLAGSLFPDRPGDKNFFTEAARKIFAHLLRYHPTPQELTHWMKNMDEIDRRVVGTELEAMIRKSAAAQRAAVQGTLNQVASAFNLLPSEPETTARWNAADWAQKRKGWIFLPSVPTLRESIRPLCSMWLDSLAMRLMDTVGQTPPRVWLILDELSSLQRLPQLPTAITESRKSNVSMIIGFQGRSQLESIYGHQCEAMLSQPMTKVFLRTSEPNAAEWVSSSIGEVEVLRLEETETRTIANIAGLRRGISRHMRQYTEPLVLASTIQGLHNLSGYVRSRDIVVSATFCYAERKQTYPGFEPRTLSNLEPLSLPASSVSEINSNVPSGTKIARNKSRKRSPQGVSGPSPQGELFKL